MRVSSGGTARGLTLAAIVATMVGFALELRDPTVAVLIDGHAIGDAAMGIACGIVAFILLGREPRHPVGRAFCVVTVFDAVAAVSGGLYGSPGASAHWTWALWVTAWSWVPGTFVPFLVVPVVLPDGARGRTRIVLWAVAAAMVGLMVGQAFGPHLTSGPHSSVANRLAVPGADTLLAIAGAVGLVAAVIATGVVIARFVHAGSTLRRQLLPMLAAILLVAVTVSTAQVLGRVGTVIQDFSEVLLPVAALVSMLRFRLYDLEIAIWRTSVWCGLSGLLVGVYVLVVQVAADGLGLHGRSSSALATAVVALAFQPIRVLLQQGLGRALYGDRGDPYSALAHTTQVLAGGADPTGALEQATRDLSYRLRSPGVRVLRDGVTLAGGGTGPAALTVPLRVGQADVGRLEVEPRSPGEQFSRADQQLILDLSAPLSAAVAAVGIDEDLRASRRRLVHARERERRRIRAELHDDIGPALAAVAVQAQIALRRIARHDSTAAAEAITTVQATTVRAVADLRSVIDALGPRALDAAGLAGALTEIAGQLASDHTAVTIDLPPFPPLTAAVEVAIFRAAAEALTNTSKHASASRVVVRGEVSAGSLMVEVVDDGCGGMPYARPGGVGVPSMRERVEEVGGRLDIRAGRDGFGTSVTVAVPLSDAVVA